MSLNIFRTGKMLTGILLLTDSNIVGLQKLSCDHSSLVKYTNFVKNFLIVNPHHLLPLLVQIVLWMTLIVCDLSVSLVSLYGVVYSSLIDLWVLAVIFDLSLSVDCSPGGVEFLAWKAMSSHFAGTVTTLEDFLRPIFKKQLLSSPLREVALHYPGTFEH